MVAIPKAKLCISVDRPVALHPRHPLFRATDALVIKDPHILRQVGNPSYHPPHLTEQDSKAIAEAVNSGRPMTFHAEGVIEESFIEQFATPEEDGKTVLELLNEKGIPYTSFHLGTSNTRIKKIGRSWFGEESTSLAYGGDYQTFLLRFMPLFEDRLRTITKFYNGILAFENMSYRPARFFTERVCEPRVINEVFSSFSNLNFLLDIAHAQVAAYWLHMDVTQYITSLPLHKVIEVHLCHPTLTTTPGIEGKHLLDTHDLPEDREYELLEYAIQKGSRPEYLTIEYSKDVDMLLGAYQRLSRYVALASTPATGNIVNNASNLELGSLNSISDNREKYGTKAVNLYRMMKLGLSVPPGFVIPANSVRGLENPTMKMLWPAIHELEEKTGKIFGDQNNPLSLSVRSSPPYSMPGLLLTVLHVEAEEQLLEAIKTVRDSWHGEAAQRYRSLHNISDDLFTAAVIQAMVFGDLNNNSASGVLFTQDPISGEDKLSGCFAVKTLGKSVVSRSKIETQSIDFYLERKFLQVYAQFTKIKDVLEKEFKYVQEVEFVIEDGKLWVLQTRDAALSPHAQAKAALSLERRGIINQFQMLDIMKKASKRKIYKLEKSDDYDPINNALGRGKSPSSPGAVSGPVVFSLDKAREFARLGKLAILVALERTEDIQLAILNGEVAGIITQYGHEALHEAVLARSHGIPMIDGKLVGFVRRGNYTCETKIEIKNGTLLLGDKQIPEGTEIVMDAHRGFFWLKQRKSPLFKEDKTVEIEEIDFAYAEEEKAAREQFRPYSYESLIKLHTQMIKDLQYLSQITAESLRLNLAAHVVHQLIGEKGKELGKTSQKIEQDLLNIRDEEYTNLFFAYDQNIVKMLGIKEIRIHASGFGIYFLPFSFAIRPLPGSEVQIAIAAHSSFVRNVTNCGLIDLAKIKVVDFEAWDPMPHGHASMYSAYCLGVEFEMGPTPELKIIKLLNELIEKISGKTPVRVDFMINKKKP